MDKLEIILTVGVGFAAFLSPLAVAIINNRHARILRKAELKHAERIKQLDCEHSYSIEKLNAIFNSKNQAFLNLIECLAKFYDSPDDNGHRIQLLSAMYKAALYCENTQIQNNILNLVNYVKSGFSNNSEDSIENFKVSMESLVYALHFEITGLDPNKDIEN